MTKRPTADEQPVLRLRSPEDLVTALPYIIGFHPRESLVATAFAGPRSRLSFTARVDLPEAGDTAAAEAVAAQVAAMLERQCGGAAQATATLVAYGPRERAEQTAGLTEQRLVEVGIPVRETLRVEAGRYWSMSCQDPRCCPPEGTPYDAGSQIAARATFAGLVALPDRETLERSVAPVDGAERAAIVAATERVEARLADWAAEAEDADGMRRRMIDEGRALLADVLDRYRPRGGGGGPDGAVVDARLTPDEVAWLGVLLLLHPVRDEAWVLIDTARRAAHLALWTEVVRRVGPAHAAAPASLLAFAAWQDGNGALAWIALDRALQAEPDYSMARLIGSALTAGAPPIAWPDMNVADVRRRYDRPDPPPDPRPPASKRYAAAAPREAAPRPPGRSRRRRRRYRAGTRRRGRGRRRRRCTGAARTAVMTDLPVHEELRDHPDHVPARGERGVGQDTHEPDMPAAVHQADTRVGQLTGERAGAVGILARHARGRAREHRYPHTASVERSMDRLAAARPRWLRPSLGRRPTTPMGLRAGGRLSIPLEVIRDPQMRFRLCRCRPPAYGLSSV